MAIASAGANGGAGDAGGTAPSSSVMSKVDKTGLYDLQQVKRVLDDLVIDVRVRARACCGRHLYIFRAIFWQRRRACVPRLF